MKRKLCALLCVIAAFLLVGCTSSEQKNTEYLQSVRTAMTAISDATEPFSADLDAMFSSITDETKKKVLDDLAAMKQAYASLSQLKAPSEYEQVQTLLAESAAKASAGIEIYEKAIGELSPSTFNQSFVDSLAPGDEAMKEAFAKLDEVSALLINAE